MVRVIQPAGFTRLNLLQIGLNDDFDEVVFLCSPESMNELEYERIVSTAKELGSKAVFSRHELPVIGENATVSEIVQNLKLLKNELSDVETVISTTGGTLKLGACLNYIFPESNSVGMNWREEVFLYSNGTKKPMEKIPEEIIWKIFGLRLVTRQNNNFLYYGDELVATPSNVFLDKNKLQLEWINPMPPNKQNNKVNRSVKAKEISRQIGRLCRINSEHRYNFSVPMSNWDDYDRYPINTNRPIQPNDFFTQIPNEFFSSIQLPKFPIGEAKANELCLHVIVNVNDITPTAEAILGHQPDHVVLWFLDNEVELQKKLEYRGKIGFLTSFIHGTLTDNLNHFKLINNSEILKLKPLKKSKMKFHLAEISEIENVKSFTDFPDSKRTIFETNSGFIGFQRAIIAQLKECEINFELWYTDLIAAKTSIISIHENKEIDLERDVGKNLLLRKRIPTKGDIISTKADFKKKLSIVMEAILLSKYSGKDGIWRLNSGQYTVKSRSVKIHSKPKLAPTVFNIWLDDEHLLTLGQEGQNNSGLWLEELTAHMIHSFWNSKYTVVGLSSQPFTGNPTAIGTLDEIDVYALTEFGEVIAEVKAVSATTPASFREAIGQLYGELAVVGHRKGQIPIIVIGSPTEHLDAFANKNNVVICNWWELQHPERILFRLKTGQRSPKELEEKETIRKSAEQAQREEEIARKAEEERLAQEIVEADTLFSGQVSLTQVERYQDSEAAFVIRGVPELEHAVISVAKTKFKVFFDSAKNRSKWIGYEIIVKSTIPQEISSRDNFVTESTAYLEYLKTIESCEDE